MSTELNIITNNDVDTQALLENLCFHAVKIKKTILKKIVSLLFTRQRLNSQEGRSSLNLSVAITLTADETIHGWVRLRFK